MKTRLKLLAGVALVGVLYFSSCSSDEHFTYYIENTTHYCIDSGRFDVQDFKLGPYATAGPFEGAYLVPFFSEPMLLLHIPAYSDADSSYVTPFGVVGGREMIEPDKTYLVRIVASPDSTKPIFRFEVKESEKGLSER